MNSISAPDLLPAIDLGSLWALLWPAMAIAALRVGDITLNVFRTVFMVAGRKGLAALFHSFEAGVWLSAAGIVFADVTPLRAAGFVVGVAVGTYLGMSIVQRLQMGMVTVRIYVDDDNHLDAGLQLAKELHAEGFGATTFVGRGYRGPVQMVLSTVRRRDADDVMEIARVISPGSFMAIDNELRPATSARV